jgi:Arc/MetJ-type ribon-helix-helix transcriptional regulator
MALADPFSLRLSPQQIEFLDLLRERHGFISRPTAIRHLIEEARTRDARRQRAEQRRQHTAA